MNYFEQAQLWIEHTPEDAELAQELRKLVAAQDEPALQDRFYQNLAFGTAGLRGIIGAGTNRMNVYTVGKTTQGLAQYILKTGAKKRVAIAYDSRIKGEFFAMQAARVLAANGIEALLYPELAPTPALSFAVRYHGCGAGICVTASHNPGEYNGYKVYGADGCQITDAAADAILNEIAGVDLFSGIKLISKDDGIANGCITYLNEKTTNAFLDAVSALRLEQADCDTISIVYSPLNGTGLKYVTEMLSRMGVKNLHVVREQREPDGNFTTCKRPNPEERDALKLGLTLCRATGADLLLATDPDCDRVGIAARDGDDYRLFTGNEVGTLLLDYVCRRRLANGTMPENPVAVKTIVTTEMAARVAAEYGVQLVDVLTGFKYIGETIAGLEAQGDASRYIFGFEESCGYLSGSHVRDKDAVNAAMLICDMAQSYLREGITLAQAMDALYQKHGYWLSSLESYAFAGAAGMETMRGLMNTLRRNPPVSLGGAAVAQCTDYLWHEGDSAAHTLPSSDVLQYTLEDGGIVTVRPSGTEPKIKFYYSLCGSSVSDAQTRLKAAQDDMKRNLSL